MVWRHCLCPSRVYSDNQVDSALMGAVSIFQSRGWEYFCRAQRGTCKFEGEALARHLSE
jgi:hypothetical protein